MIRRLAAAGLAITAVGCVASGPGTYADHLYLDTSREPCRYQGRDVQILQQPPERPYARVAYVEAYAGFYAENEVSWGKLRAQLCKQAVKVDADAIIELTVGGRSYSRLVQALGFEVSTGGESKKLTGIAIRYTEPPR